jgi:hypothetical protein
MKINKTPKEGDLVKVVRESVLVPKNQVGIVTRVYLTNTEPFVCFLHVLGGSANGQVVRVLARDLDIL